MIIKRNTDIGKYFMRSKLQENIDQDIMLWTGREK